MKMVKKKITVKFLRIEKTHDSVFDYHKDIKKAWVGNDAV